MQVESGRMWFQSQIFPNVIGHAPYLFNTESEIYFDKWRALKHELYIVYVPNKIVVLIRYIAGLQLISVGVSLLKKPFQVF